MSSLIRQANELEGDRVKTTWLDYLLSTAAVSLLLVLSVGCVVIASPTLHAWCGDYHVLVELALGMLLYGVFAALLARCMLRIKPIAPGAYGEDSTVFTYWKLITVVQRLGQGAMRPFTPVFLLPVVDALYGARIGKDVAFGGEINDPYMVSVGDGTTLGTQTIISGSFTGQGTLTCGFVRIGRNVTVGPNTTILPDTEIGDGASVLIGSCLMPGARIPAGEVWRGNPARKWVQTRVPSASVATD